MEMMNSIAQLSTAMANTEIGVQLNMSMQKKAMDTQAAAVAQIFNSMPPAMPGENGYIFNATA